MHFRHWFEAIEFPHVATQLLAAWFEGTDSLFALHDVFEEHGLQDLSFLLRYALESESLPNNPNRNPMPRNALIQFNSIFRKLSNSFRDFKPVRWRVDDNKINKAAYMAEVRESGKVKTRKGGVEWPYFSIFYSLHRGGNWKSGAIYHGPWSGGYGYRNDPELDALVQKMRSVGVAAIHEETGPTGEQIWKNGQGGLDYHRTMNASEFPEGMLWRGFFTLLSTYGSKDLLRLMGTTRR